MGFGIYSLIEAGVLLINALAILNEERFLSKSRQPTPLLLELFWTWVFSSTHNWFTLAIMMNNLFFPPVGWSASAPTDNFTYGVGEAPGVKTRLIELISSVRTLMRSEYNSLENYFVRKRLINILFHLSWLTPFYFSSSDIRQLFDNNFRTLIRINWTIEGFNHSYWIITKRGLKLAGRLI